VVFSTLILIASKIYQEESSYKTELHLKILLPFSIGIFLCMSKRIPIFGGQENVSKGQYSFQKKRFS